MKAVIATLVSIVAVGLMAWWFLDGLAALVVVCMTCGSVWIVSSNHSARLEVEASVRADVAMDEVLHPVGPAVRTDLALDGDDLPRDAASQDNGPQF